MPTSKISKLFSKPIPPSKLPTKAEKSYGWVLTSSEVLKLLQEKEEKKCCQTAKRAPSRGSRKEVTAETTCTEKEQQKKQPRYCVCRKLLLLQNHSIIKKIIHSCFVNLLSCFTGPTDLPY